MVDIQWTPASRLHNKQHVEDELRWAHSAFAANFPDVVIHKAQHPSMFYIYKSMDDYEADMTHRDGRQFRYVKSCKSVDELNGWFYGMAQAANDIVIQSGDVIHMSVEDLINRISTHVENMKGKHADPMCEYISGMNDCLAAVVNEISKAMAKV